MVCFQESTPGGIHMVYILTKKDSPLVLFSGSRVKEQLNFEVSRDNYLHNKLQIQVPGSEIVTSWSPMRLKIELRWPSQLVSWRLIVKSFNLNRVKKFHALFQFKNEGQFPSNYSLNTCLQDNLSNQRYYVAIHEVLTYRQDAVGALHKHVFPFSQNEYSLTAMSAGELHKFASFFL